MHASRSNLAADECVCREAAGADGPGTVLLHQPGLSDCRQHERQGRNGHRRCTCLLFAVRFHSKCSSVVS